MVAERVEVISKSWLDSKAHKWSSDGKSGYQVEEVERQNRGTDVILYFSESESELLKDWKIKELIKKYSNYVPVPIMLEEEVNEDGKDTTKREWKQINETKAIWKKMKSEVSEQEYKDFYQSVSMDFNAPLWKIHASTEGVVSYKTLLYIPQETNMFADMRDPNKDYGPKLYVQNVLILEHAKELLPVWLRFVSGVVETNDLPLNISREMLQSNKTLDTIKKSLIKKILSELQKLRKADPVKYATFFKNYGSILKEGVYYEHDIKEDIAWVLEFQTLLQNKYVSLDEYLENILSPSPENKSETDSSSKENSKIIYYITGKSQAEVLASPYLEQFRKNKVDVLLLTEAIDEWMIGVLSEYKWATLKSITASDIELTEKTEEEKKKEEKQVKDYKDLLELAKNTIGSEKLEKVELNPNLWEALGALRTPDWAMNPQMEKMMRAMGQAVPATKRILELNPNNALVKAMKKEFSADVKSKKLKDIMSFAYMQAVLLEWGELEDVSQFVKLTQSFAKEYMK